MTDFYADLAQTALDLIAEFGREVQHAPKGTADFDVTKPWRGQQPSTPAPITAAIFDATVNDRQSFPDLDFTKRALVAAQGLSPVPVVEDQIIDDITYRIVRVVETKPGPVALVYTLLLSAKKS